MTDDLGNDTLRILALAAKIRQAHYDLMAGHCPHILALGNEHIGVDFLVIRHYKAVILVFLIKAHQSLVCTPDHLDDCAFRAFSPGSRTRRDLHGVTMHGIPGLLRRNEYILVHALHGYKTEALGMSAKYSGQGEGLRFSIFSAFGKSHLALGHQSIQNLF